MIVGIGSAIVDILAYKDEDFITSNNLILGSMKLIDADESSRLSERIGAASQCSGGSVANTIAGIGLLGGECAFIGKTGRDTYGKIFNRSLEKSGAKSLVHSDAGETARCIVIVSGQDTNRVERTMATYLGNAGNIYAGDIDEEEIAKAKIIFFEGYLWDSENAKSAVLHAIQIAKANGVEVAFSLSDKFCVERHKDEFLSLINEHVDIVIGNIEEALALYGTDDLSVIGQMSQTMCKIAAITNSDAGSSIFVDSKRYDIPASPIKEVFDTTGAGDLYATGVLYGYVNGYSPEEYGRLGSDCAKEILDLVGARPNGKLTHLLKDANAVA